MSPVFDEEQLNKVIDLLSELKNMLQQYGGINCVPGINNVASELIYGEETLDKRFKNAAQQFGRLFGGSGTLGDFVIWSEDEIERVKLNTKLSDIQNDLSSIFNLAM